LAAIRELNAGYNRISMKENVRKFRQYNVEHVKAYSRFCFGDTQLQRWAD
jgi:hypothetical protein